mgnify:CR=1 FL=1
MRFRDVVKEYSKRGRVKIDWYCASFVRPLTKKTGYYEKTTFVITEEKILNVNDLCIEGLENDDATVKALAKLPEAMDEKIIAVVQEYVHTFHTSRPKTYIITPYSESEFNRAQKKVALARISPERIKAFLERA